MIVAVNGDGEVSGRYRLTAAGLERLSPEDERTRPRGRTRAIGRRLRRLEDQTGLQGAMCRRMLYRTALLSENVVLGSSNARELTRRGAGQVGREFSLEVADGRIRWRPLPPP